MKCFKLLPVPLLSSNGEVYEVSVQSSGPKPSGVIKSEIGNLIPECPSIKSKS